MICKGNRVISFTIRELRQSAARSSITVTYPANENFTTMM